MHRPLLAALLCASAPAVDPLVILVPINYDRIPQGERGAVEGGAVSVRSSDASAAWYNPANLGGVSSGTVSASASLVEFTRTTTTVEGGSVREDQLGLRPNHVGAAWRLDDGVGFALSLATPMAWSGALEIRRNDGGNRSTRNANASLVVFEPAMALGWSVDERIQLGCTLASRVVDYRSDTGLVGDDGTTRITGTSSDAGRALQVRLILGMSLRLGQLQGAVTMWTPTGTISSQGTASQSQLTTNAATSTLIDVRDDNAGFELRQPAGGSLAIAWVDAQDRWSIEGNLRVHAADRNFAVFKSALGTSTVTSGGTTTTTPYTIPSRSTSLRWIVNPQGGAQLRLPWTPDGKILRAHIGGYIDSSPVASSDTFSAMNIYGGTVGISMTGDIASFTVGGQYQTNASPREVLTGGPAAGLDPNQGGDADLNVRIFGVVFASSFRF